jgi:hypothetical protein
VRFGVVAVSLSFGLGLAQEASAQLFVLPQRANKSHVRYFDFDWMTVDLLAGARFRPEPPWTVTSTGAVGVLAGTSSTSTVARIKTSTRSLDAPGIAGGIRVYFYRQADVIAERAAASIESTYKEYIDSFGYVPSERFPYVLYSSYQEFLSTNLFPVQEGILGVTSTIDLKLALPFFGDYRLFREVSRHEMAHQFSIQKVREASKEADTSNAIDDLPLWLVEGLAEYYAKDGLDPESEMLTLDIVLNPNVKEGYGLLGFFEDRPYSGLWTYKMGQARCAFLDETYGKGTVQRILSASPLLESDVGSRERIREFPAFLHALLGDQPRAISAKFEHWIKRRAMAKYLRARQSPADLDMLEGLPEYIDSFAASPSGQAIVHRSLDPDTGQSRLTLFDYRDPTEDAFVVADGVPGYETLHPFQGRNFALSDHELAFIAEDRGADVLYVQAYKHKAKRVIHEKPKSDPKVKEPTWKLPGLEKAMHYETEVSLGERRAYDLREKGIVAAYSPAFSPDGKRIVLVGLDRHGQRDLFLIDPKDDEKFVVTRLTHDEYAERAVVWGKNGIYVTSDATRYGIHNVLNIKPETPIMVTPVYVESREQRAPTMTADGNLAFISLDDGRANAYEVDGGRLVQRTDLPTGLFEMSAGPDGGMWALLQHQGRRRIVYIDKASLLAIDRTGDKLVDADEPVGEPELRPRAPLTAAEPYHPEHLSNWKLDNVFALAGVGAGRVLGRVLATASDRLANHAVILDLAALGSFDLIDGQLVYINQSGRLTWGGGLFQSLFFRLDPTFGNTALSFFSAERYFGGLVLARMPLNHFVYLQGDFSVGAADFVLDSNVRDQLRMLPGPSPGQSLSDVWDQFNGGLHFRSMASLALGYDTIRYHRSRGPIDGRSVLLRGSFGVQPFGNFETLGDLRLDAEQHFFLFRTIELLFRGGAASTYGGKFARQYFLSSFDTLRGVPFADEYFLLGRAYWFTTAEVQLPLNAIIALAFLTDIEAIAGVDFGGVSDALDALFDKRVLDFALGFNFGLGPLVFRLHFAKPVNIGALVPNEGHWVTNFSFAWLYF